MSYQAPVLPPTGTTFVQFQQGGISAMLDRLINTIVAGGATPAPTAPATLAAGGTGGTLPANTYFVVFTELNGIGETTASPVSTGQAVTLGQGLTITFPTLQTGNVSRNAYVGTSAGGPFSLAAMGVSLGSVTILTPLPAGGAQPPAINTTTLSTQKMSNLRSPKQGNLQTIYTNVSTMADVWNRGEPMPTRDVAIKLRDAHIVFVALAQICQEAGTLMDANPGTLGTKVKNPLNVAVGFRTWP